MDIVERKQIVQNVIRDVLKDIALFCDKHDIEFFMMYGSLIGAVRHKGMIPWDDDIDIAMTRENYRRFVECVETDGNDLLQNNEVHISGSGSIEYVSEIKVGRRGTKYCPKFGENLNIFSQINVDIFCVDYLKSSYIKHIVQTNKLRILLAISKLNCQEKRFMTRVFKQTEGSFKYLKIMALWTLHLLRLICSEKGVERLIYKMVVDTTSNSKFMGVSHGGRIPLFFSSDFTLNRVEFDGIGVFIPSNYDEILSRIYGDYMTLPPENERYGLDKYEIVLEVN